MKGWGALGWITVWGPGYWRDGGRWGGCRWGLGGLESVRMYVCVCGGEGGGCREGWMQGERPDCPVPSLLHPLPWPSAVWILTPPINPPSASKHCSAPVGCHRWTFGFTHTHTHTGAVDSIMLSEHIDGYGHCVLTLLITLHYLYGE